MLPARLVEDGTPVIASWNAALDDPNLEDAFVPHTLDALRDVPVLAHVEELYRTKLRHKCWQYMTVSAGDLFLAFAIGTAGFAGNGFVYVVEPTGRVTKRFAITPLSAGVSLARSSAAGQHRFATRGLTITVDNLDGGRSFDARIDCAEVRAMLSFTSDGGEHSAICVPLPGGRCNYTHKYSAFAVTGYVELDGRRKDVKGFGSVDFTKMYALRHAVWRWVSVSGKAKNGQVVGINLVDPTPPAHFSENCAWVDGVRKPLVDVTIKDAKATAIGLDLRWKPIGVVEQRLDVPLLRHRLVHTVSAFSGRFEGIDLAGMTGVYEDNDTWW